jgi:hypothetical protein
MHKAVYGMAMASLCLVAMLALPHAAWSGSPRPRPPIDLDAEPFCTGCHAAVSESHHPERRAETSKNGVYTTKHYEVRAKGVGELRPGEPEQPQQFLEQARTIGGKAM